MITYLPKMMSDKTITYCIMESPVGQLTILASDQGLQAVIWDNDRARQVQEKYPENPHHPILKKAAEQLKAYFLGHLKTFDIPLDMQGTPFQQQVWTLLQEIPYGHLASYGTLAEKLGDTRKARAVGAANGSNPVPIIVPCHRVVGSNGALTGFAGGLDVKLQLLRLEQQHKTPATTGQFDLFVGQ